ncbi:hypothetical protein [Clostridium beijerinckii]|uniref:Uncharacterized protein n=1 Tax=Clostridium beijerinckii TaxID=1520 RepID=A0A1S8S9Y6_CLOBE|nr:hypothetical protein [Clostridium beijerinckii]NRY59865.1 hypothetical protein [Clostridium beijerinckii]OOM62219.1 hypothetical protein CLBCK_19220 [Clostridium beijerinckii]
MSKLTNKAIKELLMKVSEVMNDYEQYEIENGDAWGYVLKLNPNKNIECRIMDDEWCEYTMAIPSDNISGVKDILKGFINYLYENEINFRNGYLKANKGWYARKHKSLNTWFERNNRTKIDAIVEDISERYSTTKRLENEVEHYKVFISRLYYVLNCLVPNYKLEDIKEVTFKRLNEFNIKNVGISNIDNKLIVMKSNDDSSYIIDKFDIEIDSYSNVNIIVNQIVSRLRKVA